MTYEALVHGKRPAHLAVALTIRSAIQAKDFALVAKVYAPIRAAFQVAPDRLTPELEVEEQRADGLEDVVQVAYALSPTRPLARQRVKAIDVLLGRLIQQRQALQAQWQL